MEKVRLTHKGWFGVAPVYLAEEASTEEEVYLTARVEWLNWLVEANAWIFDRCADVMELMGQEPAGYPVTITGELPESEQKWMEVDQ